MSDADDLDSIRQKRRDELLSATEPGAGQEESSAAPAPDEPIHIRGVDHLQEVAADYDVVLADYYADWCGPCKMLEPIVAEIARETDAAVAKVDIDAHQDLAMNAGVRGVPTLFLYYEGEPIKRLVGLQDAGTLRGLVEQYL